MKIPRFIFLIFFGLTMSLIAAYYYEISSTLLIIVAFMTWWTMLGLMQYVASHKKEVLDALLEKKMRNRFSEIDNLPSMKIRLEELAAWSEHWATQLKMAQMRLSHYYNRRFNSEASWVANEALWFELECARHSLLQRVYGQGLDLFMARTRHIRGWIEGYEQPLSQFEIDSILRTNPTLLAPDMDNNHD